MCHTVLKTRSVNTARLIPHLTATTACKLRCNYSQTCYVSSRLILDMCMLSDNIDMQLETTDNMLEWHM